MKKVILSIFVAVALVACSTGTDCAKDCADSTAVVATDSVAPAVVVTASTAPVAPVEAVK